VNRDNKAIADMRSAVETAERRAVAVGDAVVKVVTTRRMRAASRAPNVDKAT
jgi:hypothetical protein